MAAGKQNSTKFKPFIYIQITVFFFKYIKGYDVTILQRKRLSKMTANNH